MLDNRQTNPDHEALARLAREDPTAFEALRTELIHELIERAPEHLRRRLECVQFRVDAVRRRSRNALGTTVKVYQMMWSSFLGLRDELCNFRQPAKPVGKTAKVLDFRPRKAHPSPA